MKKFGLSIALFFLSCGSVHTASAQDDVVTVASWNIQTLTTGRKVFSDSHERVAADFADLSGIRSRIGADIFALQETSSLAALSRVFPVTEYTLCISGQFEADLNGLGVEEAASTPSQPACYDATTGEPPDVPLEAEPKQYTAFAIKRAAGVEVLATNDVKALGVVHDPDQRVTRWGLEMRVKAGNRQLTLLNVHLKSGCFLGAIASGSANMHCPTLAKQLQPLKDWIEMTRNAGREFVILGDFNRRLDLESGQPLQTDMWDRMEGAGDMDTGNDVDLWRDPFRLEKKCWTEDSNDMRWPIDFFVFSPDAHQAEVAGSFAKLAYTEIAPSGVTWTKSNDAERLSDHCPIKVSFVTGSSMNVTASGSVQSIYHVYCNDGIVDSYVPAPVFFRDEQEALGWAHSCGAISLMFKDSKPWKMFDNEANTYTITED